jgi:hypothetical protein
MTGYTPVAVGYILDNPLVMDQVERLQDARDGSAVDIASQIDAIAPKALSLVNQVIDGIVKDPATGQPVLDPQTGKPITYQADLRYKAAKDILAASGNGPVQRVRAQVSHGLFTAEDIERFNRRAKEAGVVSEARALVGAEDLKVKEDKHNE